MRGLVALVIGMGVLIVLGTAVVIGTIVRRLSAPPAPAAEVVLQEPTGTHIAAASEAGNRLTAVLQGGGPDRVVVIDLASGRRLARVSLAH